MSVSSDIKKFSLPAAAMYPHSDKTYLQSVSFLLLSLTPVPLTTDLFLKLHENGGMARGFKLLS